GADVTTALAESRVLRQGAADAPRPHHPDAVGALEAQDLAEPGRQCRDGVAETAFAEGAEEGEVLAHLGGSGAAAARQLGGGDGLVPLSLRLLEVAQVQRQPPHRAL